MAAPQLVDFVTTDSSSAVTTHSLSFPACSAGDLVLFHASTSGALTITLTGTGPNGETPVMVAQARAAGATDGAGGVWFFIATAAASAGTLGITLSAASGVRCTTGRVPSGDFNALAPIDASQALSRALSSTADSFALTAGAADGRVVNVLATDTTSGGVTPPAGWTSQSGISATGSAVEVLRRDAVTTAAEAVPAFTFTMAVARRVTTITYTIAPVAATATHRRASLIRRAIIHKFF
jgi:hypothetical protein